MINIDEQNVFYNKLLIVVQLMKKIIMFDSAYDEMRSNIIFKKLYYELGLYNDYVQDQK